jgi:hypothetical protein
MSTVPRWQFYPGLAVDITRKYSIVDTDVYLNQFCLSMSTWSSQYVCMCPII